MYTYIIELTPEILPELSDGEVETFEQITLEEVQEALANGEFKANCSVTWILYSIPTGVINTENEKIVHEMSTYLQRRLDYPTR